MFRKLFFLILIISFYDFCFTQVPINVGEIYDYYYNTDQSFFPKNTKSVKINYYNNINFSRGSYTEKYFFKLDTKGRINKKIYYKLINDTIEYIFDENDMWIEKKETYKNIKREILKDSLNGKVKMVYSNGNEINIILLNNGLIDSINYGNYSHKYLYDTNYQLIIKKKYEKDFGEELLINNVTYKYGDNFMKESILYISHYDRDSSFIYKTTYYNNDTLPIKIVDVKEYKERTETYIVTNRYEGTLLKLTTISCSCPADNFYVKYFYDNKKSLIEKSKYRNSEKDPIEKTTYSYEYWK